MIPIFLVTVVLVLAFGLSVQLQLYGLRKNPDKYLVATTNFDLGVVILLLPFTILLCMIGVTQRSLKKMESDTLMSYLVGAIGWVMVGLGLFIWRT